MRAEKGENKKKGMEWKEWDSNKFGRMSTPGLLVKYCAYAECLKMSLITLPVRGA